MALQFCTLAGVDDTTPLFELAVVSDSYPYAEWAFMYAPNRPQSHGRYPSVARMQRAFAELPRYVRLALHVCDSAVEDLLADEPVISGLVTAVGARFGRVQLDFMESEHKVSRTNLKEFMLRRPEIEFITLHNDKNTGLTGALAAVPNHSILFDTSPERKEKPEAWTKATYKKRCGYSGGLSGDTLEQELPWIYTAAGGEHFWISMGRSLRDQNNRFDVHAATDCLERAGFEMAGRNELPKQHPRRRQCELIELYESGLTQENDSAADFEVMLQDLVQASQGVAEPNLVEVRRRAEGLLLRKGLAAPTYGAGSASAP